MRTYWGMCTSTQYSCKDASWASWHGTKVFNKSWTIHQLICLWPSLERVEAWQILGQYSSAFCGCASDWVSLQFHNLLRFQWKYDAFVGSSFANSRAPAGHHVNFENLCKTARDFMLCLCQTIRTPPRGTTFLTGNQPFGSRCGKNTLVIQWTCSTSVNLGFMTTPWLA